MHDFMSGDPVLKTEQDFKLNGGLPEILWLITSVTDVEPQGAMSLSNEGRAAENYRKTSGCHVGAASVSGDHAHRQGSGRATQSHSDTRFGTRSH